MQTSRVSNLIIFRINNVKFSVHGFYMNPNMYWNFQICISVPLSKKQINKYNWQFESSQTKESEIN